MTIIPLLQLFAYLRQRLFPALLALLSLAAATRSTTAQSPTAAPPPTPQPPPKSTYRPSLLYPYAGLFCGLGDSTSSTATKPTAGCGAGFTFIPIPIYTEVGILAPQANRSYMTGYVSVDASTPVAPTHGRYLPLALLGYSRLFETGHALDYGLALILPKPTRLAHAWGDNLRLELRDYYTHANPTQHNILLRLGLIAYETD